MVGKEQYSHKRFDDVSSESESESESSSEVEGPNVTSDMMLKVMEYMLNTSKKKKKKKKKGSKKTASFGMEISPNLDNNKEKKRFSGGVMEISPRTDCNDSNTTNSNKRVKLFDYSDEDIMCVDSSGNRISLSDFRKKERQTRNIPPKRDKKMRDEINNMQIVDRSKNSLREESMDDRINNMKPLGWNNVALRDRWRNDRKNNDMQNFGRHLEYPDIRNRSSWPKNNFDNISERLSVQNSGDIDPRTYLYTTIPERGYPLALIPDPPVDKDQLIFWISIKPYDVRVLLRLVLGRSYMQIRPEDREHFYGLTFHSKDHSKVVNPFRVPLAMKKIEGFIYNRNRTRPYGVPNMYEVVRYLIRINRYAKYLIDLPAAVHMIRLLAYKIYYRICLRRNIHRNDWVDAKPWAQFIELDYNPNNQYHQNMFINLSRWSRGRYEDAVNDICYEVQDRYRIYFGRVLEKGNRGYIRNDDRAYGSTRDRLSRVDDTRTNDIVNNVGEKVAAKEDYKMDYYSNSARNDIVFDTDVNEKNDSVLDSEMKFAAKVNKKKDNESSDEKNQPVSRFDLKTAASEKENKSELKNLKVNDNKDYKNDIVNLKDPPMVNKNKGYKNDIVNVTSPKVATKVKENELVQIGEKVEGKEKKFEVEISTSVKDELDKNKNGRDFTALLKSKIDAHEAFLAEVATTCTKLFNVTTSAGDTVNIYIPLEINEDYCEAIYYGEFDWVRIQDLLKEVKLDEGRDLGSYQNALEKVLRNILSEHKQDLINKVNKKIKHLKHQTDVQGLYDADDSLDHSNQSDGTPFDDRWNVGFYQDVTEKKRSGKEEMLMIFNECKRLLQFLPSCLFFDLGFYLEEVDKLKFQQIKKCICPFSKSMSSWRKYVGYKIPVDHICDCKPMTVSGFKQHVFRKASTCMYHRFLGDYVREVHGKKAIFRKRLG